MLVVESRLGKARSPLAIEIRRRVCRFRGCGRIFYICRSCDRGQCYCCDEHRHQARLEQRRQANRKYQQNRAAKLDHAARQRAYIHRQSQKVTGQGRENAISSVTIESALTSIHLTKSPKQKAPEASHGESKLISASQKGSSSLVFCIVCGRSAWWPAPLPRSA